MRSLALVLGLLLALPSIATAQRARARTAFAEGQAHAGEGRWADAEAAFREALELSGNPAAAYNLALALRALGRHRDARDALRVAIEEGDEELSGEAETMRREEAARVVVLAVAAPSECTIDLDGAPIEREGATTLIETDPGERAIVVSCPERDPFRWRETLSDGDRRTIDATPEVEEEERPPPPAPPPDPLPWALIGPSLGVVAIGVLLTVVWQLDVAAVERPEFEARWADLQAAYDRATLLSGVAPTTILLGLAGTAAGLVWLLLPRSDVRVAFGPAGGSVASRW